LRTLGRFHGYEGHQGREEPPFDRMRNAFPGKVPRLENLQASQHCPNVIPTDESRFLGPVRGASSGRISFQLEPSRRRRGKAEVFCSSCAIYASPCRRHAQARTSACLDATDSKSAGESWRRKYQGAYTRFITFSITVGTATLFRRSDLPLIVRLSPTASHFEGISS
jgi:hypothetical protein